MAAGVEPRGVALLPRGCRRIGWDEAVLAEHAAHSLTRYAAHVRAFAALCGQLIGDAAMVSVCFGCEPQQLAPI